MSVRLIMRNPSRGIDRVVLLSEEPCPTVVAGHGGSLGDCNASYCWLENVGTSIPLPPPELLRDEPRDSPIWRSLEGRRWRFG